MSRVLLTMNIPIDYLWLYLTQIEKDKYLSKFWKKLVMNFG